MNGDRLGFSKEEKEAIIRSYFGADADPGWSLCRLCGEDFVFRLDLDPEAGARVRVHCTGCAGGFTWRQSLPAGRWKSLHLSYFEERYRLSQPLKCPLDDCIVTAIELPEGVVEFRCPFCNRRGRRPRKSTGLTSRRISK